MAQTYTRDCVIYLRKSKGKAGIARQRKESSTYAERLGWRVVAEFVEPNTTAFAKIGDEDAPRPEYERMIEYLSRDRSDLHDAWSRYLRPRDPSGTPPEPAEPPEPTSSDHMATVPVPDTRTEPEPQTLPMTSEVPEVPEVPHTSERPPCAWCGEPMIVTDRDQRVHPNCG